MPDEQWTLEESVRAAVTHGRAELTKLEDLADSLIETVRGGRSDSSKASAPVSRLDDYLRTFVRNLRAHLDTEHDALGSFNIVFFGRTGAGKSTLMSAFGELDGSYVSPGASDWTTDVHHVTWHDCRLYDTPGINGWGRTESRESLEATARRAVETADLVLLCFDSQNQQAMEFTKIASWIRDFGKPAVAVLNVRNPRWRHSALVPEERRRHLSDSVRQHADNITTELAQIGLAHTPIVAVHSRRALIARAATPFQGPALASFEHERTEFGPDTLAEWSNFSTLERLLSTAIQEGASDIRLSALREDVRARYRSAAAELTEMAGEFLSEADNLRDQTESLLAVIGYPTPDERTAHLTAPDSPDDVLAGLEELQGRPFNSPGRGSLDRFIKHHSTSRLAALRRESLADATTCVENAFAQQQAIDPRQFNAAVYDVTAVTTSVDGIWQARNEFLLREISATTGDFTMNLTGLTTAASFAGNGGTGMGGNVLRGAGIAAGLGAVAVPFAAANFWNPAGWAVGVAAAGVGVVGQVQQHFGKKMNAAAQQQLNAAKSQATADAANAVHDTYDAYTEALRLASRESVWKSLGPKVTQQLSHGIALRQAHRRALDLAKQLDGQAESIATAVAADDVLTRAQNALAQTPLERTALLLGEDWIPSGENHPLRSPVVTEVHDAFTARSDQSRAALTAAITDAWNSPSQSAIRAWAGELQDASLDDADLADVAKEMRRIRREKPAFAVLGDYNSGKTSLLRRILVEAGDLTDLTGQDNLEILARPATASAKRYQFPRVDLVDTPGLQSGNTSHDDTAMSALSEASLIFVVVHVNLLIGNTELLEQLAAGTQTRTARANRMIFLINRADELGADPLIDADAFLNLQDRKKEELIAALAAKSIPAETSRIHCLAADPFGMVGNTKDVSADDFDENRFWDGTDPLISAITSLPDEALTAASAVAGFDAAVDSLKRYRSALTTELAEAAQNLAGFDSRLLTLASADADAELLQKAIADNAEQAITIGVADAAAKVYQVPVGDNAALDAVVNSWTDGTQLRSAIDRYATDTERELRDWLDEHGSMIEREFDGAAQLRNSSIAATFTLGQPAPTGQVINGAGIAAGFGAKFAKALGNRQAVFAIGKKFGHKFKPWGAVKGGARVARFGAVLGAAAAAADAASMVNDSKQGKAHKANQAEAITTIQDQANDLLDLLTEGESSDGPTAFLEEARTMIADLANQTAADKDRQLQDQEKIRFRADTVDRLLDHAARIANERQEANQ